MTYEKKKALSPPDNGCKAATAHLGCQSHCLSCPFPECLEESNHPIKPDKQERNALILQLYQEGKLKIEIAKELKLDVRTVRKALKGEVRKRTGGRKRSMESNKRRDLIRQLAKEGNRRKVIARTAGVSCGYVYQVLHE